MRNLTPKEENGMRQKINELLDAGKTEEAVEEMEKYLYIKERCRENDSDTSQLLLG